MPAEREFRRPRHTSAAVGEIRVHGSTQRSNRSDHSSHPCEKWLIDAGFRVSMNVLSVGLLLLSLSALDRMSTLNETELHPTTHTRSETHDTFLASRTPRAASSNVASVNCFKDARAEIEVNQAHPWRPPFGIDRIGAPLDVLVTIDGQPAPRTEYELVAYRDQRQVATQPVHPAPNPRPPSTTAPPVGAQLFANARFSEIPEEVAFFARCIHHEQAIELARAHVDWPLFEADASARPSRVTNPVDLGAILVPHEWLLLGPDQKAIVSMAAISRDRSIPNAKLRIWFDNKSIIDFPMPLAANLLTRKEVELPLRPPTASTKLSISLVDGTRELWKKAIQTMVVTEPPTWPLFGAVETKLRYDAPIAMHNPRTGAELPSIDYNTAWSAELKDVVVLLPNGSRFVFWRGSSYVPFWSGRYNTGVSYQWAENLSIPVGHPDGSTDFPEPLFDRELRFGRVRIIESTASRVHIRWTYQATDVDYRVWGDQASEDFYFYPDGYGTRVVTLSSTSGTPYQLTEFIILTPQGAFPLDVLPNHVADILFLDGKKKRITFPTGPENSPLPGQVSALVATSQIQPIVYRFFSHTSDYASAVYYSPGDQTVPGAFWPFYDEGQMVTPTYWASHWPLSRGRWTHWTIDQGIHSGPSHNSIAGWLGMPEPLEHGEYSTLDALGNAKTMALKRWVALIAKTAESDEVLRDWARSFSKPPSLSLVGARLGLPSYSPERRALKLLIHSDAVEISLKPAEVTVNPVFELEDAPPQLAEITLDGRSLTPNEYAWDGNALWIEAVIHAKGARIGLRFHQ